MEYIAISKVRPNEDNPRYIKEEKFKKLVQSLKDFPEMANARPIVVNKEMVALGGNMRLKAMQEAGWSEVPVKIVDWSEEKQREFIIKDNVGFGDWDWDELANTWNAEELNEWGLDTPDNWGGEEMEAEEDDYQVPEELKTDVVLGDLIEIGEHRLLCGDSTDSDQVEKLMNGKKADMVFTSPPYNGNTAVNGNKLYENNNLDNKSENDYLDFLDSIQKCIYLILKSQGVICWNIMYNNNSRQSFIKNVFRFLDLGFVLNETIIWKKNAIPLSKGMSRAFEFIFVFQKDNLDFSYQNKNDYNENVWDISNAKSQIENHKACFPIELPFKGIKLFSKDNSLIYEPFLGSGTTMVAAHQLKRKCYGMELDPKYCQVIIDRMTKLDPTLSVKINGNEYVKTEH